MHAARLRQPPQSQRCYNLFDDPATRHRCRTVMKDLLKTALGKIFIHPVTRRGYGPIRLPSPPTDFARLDGSSYEACAEDSCGNNFTTTPDGAVFFWDHETDELIFLAGSISEFVSHCAEPEPGTLDPSKVVSVWVDPSYGKAHGIEAPEDGWIKKPDDHDIKKGSKPS